MQENLPQKRFLRVVGRRSPFMRPAQHPAALRARCKQCLPGRRKPDVLRPGIVGMRRSRVIRLRPRMTMSTPFPPTISIVRPCAVVNRLTSNAYLQAGVVRGLEVRLQALQPVVPPRPALPLESEVPEI